MTACRRLAWIAVAVMCGLVGWAPSAHASSASRPTVVLIAVPGLLWSDVEQMPALRALAADSSVGELSVKAAKQPPTDCADALLTVSAGNRARAFTSGCAIDMSGWPQLRASNTASRYGSAVGALGSALLAHRVFTVASNRAALPMLADGQGTVSVMSSPLRAVFAPGVVAAALDPSLYDVLPSRRAAAQHEVDGQITEVEQVMTSNEILIVAGISDGSTGGGALHALLIHGPGWAHTQLRSSAAGRAPYVQDIDIAPTILAAEGIPAPSDMAGRPMQQSGSAVPSLSSYVDDNRHAVAQRTLGQRVFLVLGVAAIVMMVLAALPLPITRTLARWLARLVAPAPVVIFIANGLPWWRWGQPAYAGIVLAGVVLLAAATTLAARSSVTDAVLIVPVFTIVALAVDQLTGATLQLSAPLGDSPIIAGRFAGMGNLDFAVFASSALIVAGIAGARLARTPAIILAVVVAGVAVVIDGAPHLGNDIGGVLALLPASIVVVALVARVRVTALRVVTALLVTVVVAIGVALVDYSRPATDQTHVGRFVGQVLHGGAGTEVRRKFDGAVGSIGLTVGTFVVCFAVVAAVMCRERIRASLAASSGVTASVMAVTVVAVLGAALNDSGITIAAMATIVGVSAIYGAGPAADLGLSGGRSPLPPPSTSPDPPAGGETLAS